MSSIGENNLNSELSRRKMENSLLLLKKQIPFVSDLG